MHNPFQKSVSPEKLGLTFELKKAVVPETTSLAGKIKSLRNEADLLQQKLDNTLAKIWDFFGGFEKFIQRPVNERCVSKSFLSHIKSIHTPDPRSSFYGGQEATQKRWDFGNYFEATLESDFETASKFEVDEAQKELAKKMVEAVKLSDLWEWIENPLVLKQHKVRFELFGFRFVVVFDYYAEAGTETEKRVYCAELKTTTAVTEKAFLKACNDFGYWVQGRLYSEIAKDGYTLFGVSKKFFGVFKVQASPENLQQGEYELLELLKLLDYYGISQYFKS
jgi:PDDEXK-like domain of unknown function (DUF3799)